MSSAVLAPPATLACGPLLANAGGVIAPYFEQKQANQAYWWSRAGR